MPAFNPSGLVKLGDVVRYGSYEVIRIGDRIYQLKDSGDPRAQKGGLIGTDMYLICGTTKALLVTSETTTSTVSWGMRSSLATTPRKSCVRSSTV